MLSWGFQNSIFSCIFFFIDLLCTFHKHFTSISQACLRRFTAQYRYFIFNGIKFSVNLILIKQIKPFNTVFFYKSHWLPFCLLLQFQVLCVHEFKCYWKKKIFKLDQAWWEGYLSCSKQMKMEWTKLKDEKNLKNGGYLPWETQSKHRLCERYIRR